MVDLALPERAGVPGIYHQTHTVAALGKPVRQINHMTKQAADGSAQNLENVQRAPPHDQNHRSKIWIVSPGRSGWWMGTSARTSSPLTIRVISTVA